MRCEYLPPNLHHVTPENIHKNVGEETNVEPCGEVRVARRAHSGGMRNVGEEPDNRSRDHSAYQLQRADGNVSGDVEEVLRTLP